MLEKKIYDTKYSLVETNIEITDYENFDDQFIKKLPNTLINFLDGEQSMRGMNYSPVRMNLKAFDDTTSFSDESYAITAFQENGIYKGISTDKRPYFLLFFQDQSIELSREDCYGQVVLYQKYPYDSLLWSVCIIKENNDSPYSQLLNPDIDLSSDLQINLKDTLEHQGKFFLSLLKLKSTPRIIFSDFTPKFQSKRGLTLLPNA